MSAFLQIFLGAGLSVFCAFAQASVIALSVPIYHAILRHTRGTNKILRIMLVLACAIIAVMAVHTVQIWTWAFSLVLLGAFETIPPSFYFVISTFTTVGYGDVVLEEGIQIFASFAGVTGMLTFGISAAMLLTVLMGLLPNFNPPQD